MYINPFSFFFFTFGFSRMCTLNFNWPANPLSLQPTNTNQFEIQSKQTQLRTLGRWMQCVMAKGYLKLNTNPKKKNWNVNQTIYPSRESIFWNLNVRFQFVFCLSRPINEQINKAIWFSFCWFRFTISNVNYPLVIVRFTYTRKCQIHTQTDAPPTLPHENHQENIKTIINRLDIEAKRQKVDNRFGFLIFGSIFSFNFSTVWM